MSERVRKILYISGTRADFGLIQSTLHKLNNDQMFELEIVATGMHLDPFYGNTVEEIEKSGLELVARVQTVLKPATGANMARAIGKMVFEFTSIIESCKPDIVLLLGDRGEMLAAAIAAVHLNTIVAHIHGGERSGTIDEMVRHAVSKLAHLHFVATEGSRQRLIAMGEYADRIVVTGAPGLDDLVSFQSLSKRELFEKYNLCSDRPIALLVFHPVLQETDSSGKDLILIVKTLINHHWRVVALAPNSDAGGDKIREVFDAYQEPSLTVFRHFIRTDFLSFLDHADVLIGNSSAGIIEAASFGIPVINVGSRQNYRERNANICDIDADQKQVSEALKWARKMGKFDANNIYGDGKAGERIAEALKSDHIGPGLLGKVLAY